MLLYIASTENMIQQNFFITSTLDQPILHVISSGCDNPVTASKQPLCTILHLIKMKSVQSTVYPKQKNMCSEVGGLWTNIDYKNSMPFTILTLSLVIRPLLPDKKEK